MGISYGWNTPPRTAMEVLLNKSRLAKSKRIALQLFNRVVALTPVDTGKARNCWVLSIGSPVYVSLPRNEGSRANPLPPATANQSDLAGLTVSDRIYIANGQPYIDLLENGSSSQAPAGMLRVALSEVEK